MARKRCTSSTAQPKCSLTATWLSHVDSESLGLSTFNGLFGICTTSVFPFRGVLMTFFTREHSILNSWISETPKRRTEPFWAGGGRNFKSIQNQAVGVTGQQPVRLRLNAFLIDISPIWMLRTMPSELIWWVERHSIYISVPDAKNVQR